MNVLYEYVSTYYIKNILKKRKNEAELPRFVVGLCGYAPPLHAMLRHVIGLHESPASSSCSMSGVMYWVWFEVEGEVGEVVVGSILRFCALRGCALVIIAGPCLAALRMVGIPGHGYSTAAV
jgi:hypothetical protein